MSTEPALVALDRALLDLRRFTAAPAVVDDDGRAIELSSLLVLDALRDEPASVRDLAARLDVAHSTASRFVTRSEQAGLVARTASPHDGRESWVEATEAGRTLTERAETYRIARLGAVVAGWDEQDVTDLSRLLTRFAQESRDVSAPRPSAGPRAAPRRRAAPRDA
ncbi:MarR family transcriptional regulator [Isoptericola sp. AK164]|uniref:MarR family winged helix-turn-helix transcriptional regulator n=1 Tax=Isoptericola sp. AK164 TaxID=3024246 RepID=UPI002418A3B7|nr:MarR family transcriptional regulator [Isoptericola sp. AK164]